MTEPVKAVLTMELNVECPECAHEFDLFQTIGNDEGWYSMQVLPDDRWEIDEDYRLEEHSIYCSECHVDFVVKGVILNVVSPI